MKYTELISEMTLEEKCSLCSGADFWHTKGVERLGIPQMMLTDGPHGLRKQIGKNDHLGLNAAYPATCFPTASAAANSWDEEMIEQMGLRLGEETRAQRVGVILGPGVNIKRSPLCGRNFEYYSEDPLLAGKCAAALIRGIQSTGVAACVKHFAANSQETLRMTNDSIVDERTLREIYLPAFELAVKEGHVKCLMTSYNMLNGQYTNENTHLLQDILTREWGYDGLIVTDWGGDNDRVSGLIAGNSLEMPGTGGETDGQIIAAVRSGVVGEELLDERIGRILRLVDDAEAAFENAPSCDLNEHHEFAARLAEESAVLLKNEGGILPLREGARVAVIGDFAKTPRYQGAGSSHIEPTKLECGLDALKAEGVNVIGFEPGFKRRGGRSQHLISRACELSMRADTVIMWLGLDEGSEAEGVDRHHMRIPENQIELLREAAKKSGVEVVEATVSNVNDIQQAVASLKGKVQGLYLPTDNVIASAVPALTKVAVPAKLPIVAGEGGMVRAGCLASIAVDYYTLGKMTGHMGADILEGKKKPADMPIQIQSADKVLINMKAAKAIGITIPEAILKGAEKIE